MKLAGSPLRRRLTSVARLVIAVAGTLEACQLARGAELKELRLADRSKSPPPILPPASYVVDPKELAPTELRSADGLRVENVATYGLDPAALIAGRAYHLELRAHANGAEPARISLRFREPTHHDTFRTFAQSIEPGNSHDYGLDFTAPAYTALAEIALEPSGGALSVDSVSLRMRPALSTTEPVTSWANSYVPAGYGLVFNDEFSGTQLDRHKWFTRYIYSSEKLDRLNDENQRYADADNHRVVGGFLKLVAKRERLSKPSGINYTSGMIRSDFTLRYGFLEARVKMPSGLGSWAAFWINSDVSETGRLSHPPEADFFEFVNNGKDDKVNEIHSAATRTPSGTAHFLYEDPSFIEKHQNYRAPFDFDQGFHTVGAEWTPSDLSLYVDGLKIYTRTFEWKYKDGELAGPAHVLLNLAIGGQWAGRYGIDDAAFPRALTVDWVRVYQKLP